LGIPTFGVDSRVIDPDSLRELGPTKPARSSSTDRRVMREVLAPARGDAEAFIELDGKRFLRTGDLGLRR